MKMKVIFANLNFKKIQIDHHIMSPGINMKDLKFWHFDYEEKLPENFIFSLKKSKNYIPIIGVIDLSKFGLKNTKIIFKRIGYAIEIRYCLYGKVFNSFKEMEKYPKYDPLRFDIVLIENLKEYQEKWQKIAKKIEILN